METQLQSCYFTKKGPSLITLFGYSSKSIPGLEINGLGKFGKSIKEKLMPLGDDMKVYSGHGMPTTIGFERINNPFLV
jgi:hypothetical protein